MTEAFNEHQSVLLAEVLENLAIKPNGVYLDATFGRGGHSQAILSHLSSAGRLLAMDKDPEAIAYAHQNFSSDSRFVIQQGSFAELIDFAKQQDVMGKIDGIFMDLGVSSPQLDNPDRGFSFMRAGKLDMRMDDSRGLSAADWIARVEEQELANVLWKFGEERYSRRIARAIVEERQQRSITTTDHLAAVIAKAHPAWQKGKNPATRSFQAIRIMINQELTDLEQGLAQSLEALKVGGRLLVISFHSLEDRLVKQFMQQQERGKEFPVGLPVKHVDIQSRLKRIGGSVKPSDKEIAMNPRARSATLRTGEKLS